MAKREYTKGSLTVLWDSDKCIHCSMCTNSMPSVFNVNARPWINLDNGSEQEIIEQVRKCPSGVISLGGSNGND